MNFRLQRSDWEFYIKTKFPLEENSKIERKEVGEEIKELNECENCVNVFYDDLVLSKGQNRDQFFIGGKHENLDIFCLYQSDFDLPKRTIKEIVTKK